MYTGTYRQMREQNETILASRTMNRVLMVGAALVDLAIEVLCSSTE